MRLTWIVVMLVLCPGCGRDDMAAAMSMQAKPGPARATRIVAARQLTALYANSPMREWNVRAGATGRDCSVLLVQTPVIMDKSMVEAMHYGAGSYRISEQSIFQMYAAKGFRSVAYRDGTGFVWFFGDAGEQELGPPCR